MTVPVVLGHVPLTPLQKIALACEILRAYIRIRWRMRHRSLPSLVAGIREAPGGRPGLAPLGGGDRAAQAATLGAAATRVLRLLPTDSRCLMQSLVLSRLLAVRGVTATLVIGARSSPDFCAHAWVEVGGVPVLPARGFDHLRLIAI